MPPVWTSELLRLAALLAAGALVGWLYDHAVLGAFLVALACLGWHLYNLYRLDLWLRTGRIEVVPDGLGVWPPVFARVEYIREKSRRRRRRWRELVRELRASAGAFPDGGVLLNQKHEIVTYNAAAERLLNLKKLRDRGQRIENLLRHPDFGAYIASGDFSRTIEMPAPAGGDAWISCLMIPYGPDQRLLLIRDITATVRLERTRRDFVANASHELRTPLTVITGYLDALAEDPAAPAPWRQPLGEMRAQAGRMAHLLDDLLELSRLDSAATCSLDRVVDIGAVLRSVRREALAMPEHPQTVEVEVGSPVGILGDEVEIHSVVSNLVSNAVRYTPSDGSIRIGWNVDAAGGHLAVTDTGIGIADEDIPRITERFYRTDRGRARQKGGTGLGLAIVKHSLRRHEAELEVRSRLGEGSTFVCHFPPHRLALSSTDSRTGPGAQAR
jgi:two-component system phosphate regulon sensor histidine kinase PhoR